MRRLHALVTATLAVLVASDALAQQSGFRLVLDEAVQTSPYSGRVYVALSRSADREPRLGMSSWFNPPPLFAQDVEGLAPGEATVLGAGALHHPTPLADLEPGTYWAQAVARRSLDSPRPGAGPGDLYSDVVSFEVSDTEGPLLELTLDQVVAEQPFQESARVKLFEIESELLSSFHGRPVRMRAGVVLPDGWAEDPERRYPIVYRIPGFGGTHFGATRRGQQVERSEEDDPARRCLQVVLDASCFRGHSVFCDSANNGPWGSALVEELVPALEETFRGPGDARFRFVTGGSSGGWASLWLQVAYPDAFGACYSHVPDPVDFRDFQRIDLYAEGENMYVDSKGERRPLARRRGEVSLWYQDFVARETVLGPGGQIHSFEACFSPRGADGEPLAVFDRESGEVDVEVAKAWEPYDIRLVLERNWDALRPKLGGKLHIYAGEVDTFYLEGATRLLKASLAELGSDAVCEIVPGMAHSSHGPGVAEMYRDLFERWEGARD